MHQNAPSWILIFKIFSGVLPPNPRFGEKGSTLENGNTQPSFPTGQRLCLSHKGKLFCWVFFFGPCLSYLMSRFFIIFLSLNNFFCGGRPVKSMLYLRLPMFLTEKMSWNCPEILKNLCPEIFFFTSGTPVNTQWQQFCHPYFRHENSWKPLYSEFIGRGVDFFKCFFSDVSSVCTVNESQKLSDSTCLFIDFHSEVMVFHRRSN